MHSTVQVSIDMHEYSWYFTSAEVVQTFIKISEDLGRFLWADGEAEMCSK